MKGLTSVSRRRPSTCPLVPGARPWCTLEYAVRTPPVPSLQRAPPRFLLGSLVRRRRAPESLLVPGGLHLPACLASRPVLPARPLRGRLGAVVRGPARPGPAPRDGRGATLPLPSAPAAPPPSPASAAAAEPEPEPEQGDRVRWRRGRPGWDGGFLCIRRAGGARADAPEGGPRSR